MAMALEDPEWIGEREDCWGFVRRFAELPGEHWMVVVVRTGVDDRAPDRIRYWVASAWVARRPGPWRLIWQRE